MTGTGTDGAVDSARVPPRPGEVLAGKYVVEGTLGKGGMGMVLSAHKVDAPSERVAIKVMLPALADRSDFAARFHREARILSSLASRHVARVIEAGNLEDGSPFIVMELLVGKDLDAVTRAHQGPMPIATVAGYVLEACDAMAEAHANGVVHRDLKPSNLFLAEQPDGPPMIKVLDFGICKALDNNDTNTEVATLTSTGSPLGSPQYMSPEQLRNAKDVDARSDIWALGNILHRLLTGKYAFEADSLGAHLMMVVHDPPTPLRARRPDAPTGLEGVILRCLAKNPARRFPTVASLARALAPYGPPGSDARVARIVEQLGVENAPLSQTSPDSAPTVPFHHDEGTFSAWNEETNDSPLYRRKRRRRWAAVVVGAVVVAGAGAAAFVTLRPGSAPSAEPTAVATVSPPPAPTPPPAASSDPGPTGIAACDDYIETVRSCMEANGSPEQVLDPIVREMRRKFHPSPGAEDAARDACVAAEKKYRANAKCGTPAGAASAPAPTASAQPGRAQAPAAAPAAAPPAATTKRKLKGLMEDQL